MDVKIRFWWHCLQQVIYKKVKSVFKSLNRLKSYNGENDEVQKYLWNVKNNTYTISAQFRQHLVAMIEFYEELEPVDPDHLTQGELRSEVMFKEDKKYHVDLKVIFQI